VSETTVLEAGFDLLLLGRDRDRFHRTSETQGVP